MKHVLLIVCMGFMVCSSALARDVGGYQVQDTFTLNGEQLVLNGAGVREKYFIGKDIYVAGLYLKAPNHDAQAILNADESMVLHIQIVSSFVTPENFTEHTLDGFKESTHGHMERIQKKIDTFLSAFSGEIHDGDIFDICYTKGKGVQVFKNGNTMPKVEIPGFEIKPALFGIWLGDRSEDKLQILARNLLNKK